MELSVTFANEIARKFEEFKSLQPVNQEAENKLGRKFRLEFNYNSNHLEGNTLTYFDTELLLIFGKVDGPHEVRELDEMKAHDVALKLLENEASDIERPLTENFIRDLNKMLLVKPYWKDAITSDGKPARKELSQGNTNLRRILYNWLAVTYFTTHRQKMSQWQ